MSLQITRVPPQEYGEVEKIASKWHVEAVKKTSSPRLVAAAVNALWITFECHRLHIEPSCQKKVYLCQDIAGQVHGIAIISEKKPQLWIDYALKNPDNIRQVGDVGRTFCKFLEDKARAEGMQTIWVHPPAPERPFYLKCGFKEETAQGEMAKLVAKL